MKAFIVFLGSIIITLCISCKSSRSNLTDYFTNTQNIVLDELTEYPNDSIGNPSHIHVTKDYIILVEPELENLLSAYNKKEHHFSRFLSKGRGPNEMINIQQINSWINSDNDFCVLHTFENIFFIFSPQDSIYQLSQKKYLPTNSSTFACDSNLLIGVLKGEKKHFYLKENTDSTLMYFGEFPQTNNYPPEIMSELLDGYCINSSKKKKFAWFSIYGDAFEIYDYKDITSPKLTCHQILSLPIFSVNKIQEQEHAVFSPDTKIGIVSITSSNEYIFALYNNNTLKDVSKLKDNIFFSNQVLIYTWDGVPVKILNLNESVKAISFDKTNNTLFCIACDENGPKILLKKLDL